MTTVIETNAGKPAQEAGFVEAAALYGLGCDVSDRREQMFAAALNPPSEDTPVRCMAVGRVRERGRIQISAVTWMEVDGVVHRMLGGYQNTIVTDGMRAEERPGGFVTVTGHTGPSFAMTADDYKNLLAQAV